MNATPNRTDRILAAGVHVSDLFFPLVGPLIALLLNGGRNRYVAFHGWKAMLEFVYLKLALLTVGIFSLGYTLYNLYQRFMSFDWSGMLLRMLAGWVLLAILEALNSAQSIWQAWQAYQGSWGGKSPADRTARRYAGIDQDRVLGW